MRKTKEENRRRKQGAYVDFVPDGDPVGTGALSSAHPRMSVSIGNAEPTDQRPSIVIGSAGRRATGADTFMRFINRG